MKNMSSLFKKDKLMRKKILCAVMVTVMVAGVLSSCGKKNDSKSIEKENDTESVTETVTNTEITTESTEKKDDLLTITTSTICSRELYDFFKLYIGCYVDCFYKGNGGEPTNITNMIEKHKGVTGYLFTLNGMRVVSDYDDGYFGALYQPSGIRNTLMPFATKKDKVASVSYNCNVTCVKANFSSFKYKPQTDAELKLVVKVNWSCKGTYDHTGSDMFCVVLVNDSDNPAEWLLKAIYDVEDHKNGEYLVKGKGIKDNIEGLAFFDTKLIDEDKEVVDTSDMKGWRKAFADYIYSNFYDNVSGYKFVDINSDGQPELCIKYGGGDKIGILNYTKSKRVQLIEALNSHSGFSYGNGKIIDSYMRTGTATDYVYYYHSSSGEFDISFRGTYDGYDTDTPNNYHRIGVDKIELTKEEYENELNRAKGDSEFISLCDGFSTDDVIIALKNYK